MTYMSIKNTATTTTQKSLRDFSLITGRGATKREGGGACEVLSLQQGGWKSFSHVEGGGGHKKFLGIFLRCSLKF